MILHEQMYLFYFFIPRVAREVFIRMCVCVYIYINIKYNIHCINFLWNALMWSTLILNLMCVDFSNIYVICLFSKHSTNLVDVSIIFYVYSSILRPHSLLVFILLRFKDYRGVYNLCHVIFEIGSKGPLNPWSIAYTIKSTRMGVWKEPPVFVTSNLCH